MAAYAPDLARHDTNKTEYQQHMRALDRPAESGMIRTGSSGAAASDYQSRHAVPDRPEQTKPKAKGQKGFAPGHSRFAASAAAAEPVGHPKKRKVC